MHRQISALLNDYRTASARLDALAVRIPDDRWGVRPDPARWSLSENIEHLNITSEAFLPALRHGIDEARARGRFTGHYRRDPLGWFMWRMMGPPVRMKVSTTPAFVPDTGRPAQEIRDRFAALQAELSALVVAADGLPVHQVKVQSPFSARARYNLDAALGVVVRHQHRHLWQAEQTYVTPGADNAH